MTFNCILELYRIYKRYENFAEHIIIPQIWSIHSIYIYYAYAHKTDGIEIECLAYYDLVKLSRIVTYSNNSNVNLMNRWCQSQYTKRNTNAVFNNRTELHNGRRMKNWFNYQSFIFDFMKGYNANQIVIMTFECFKYVKIVDFHLK